MVGPVCALISLGTLAFVVSRAISRLALFLLVTGLFLAPGILLVFAPAALWATSLMTPLWAPDFQVRIDRGFCFLLRQRRFSVFGCVGRRFGNRSL